MLALGSDSVAQGASLCALRIFFQQTFVLDNFRHETVDHFRHGPELLRPLGQQPGIQRTTLHANATRKHITRQIQAAHGITKKDLLRDSHGSNPFYIRKAYILFSLTTIDERYLPLPTKYNIHYATTQARQNPPGSGRTSIPEQSEEHTSELQSRADLVCS